MNYHDALSVLAGERAAAHDTEGDTEGSGVPPSVKWDPVSREHMISYQGRDMMEHLATYPTLAFIQVRRHTARNLFPFPRVQIMYVGDPISVSPRLDCLVNCLGSSGTIHDVGVLIVLLT